MIYKGYQGHPAGKGVWECQGTPVGSLSLPFWALRACSAPGDATSWCYSDCGGSCVSVPEARWFMRGGCSVLCPTCQASVKEIGTMWQSATNQLASCVLGSRSNLGAEKNSSFVARVLLIYSSMLRTSPPCLDVCKGFLEWSFQEEKGRQPVQSVNSSKM